MDKFWTEVADAILPLEKVSKDLGNWARIYTGVGSTFANNVNSDRGYWSYKNAKEGFQKSLDYNWKTLVNKLEKLEIFDTFGDFLIARDQHFQYKALDVLENTYLQLENEVLCWCKECKVNV